MWLKGNLHAHTTNSDGDSPPNVVAAWYRDHGYDFLSLTDHNRLTKPSSVSRASLGDMFLMAGEEITMPLGVHVNAINLTHEIAAPEAPAGATELREAMSRHMPGGAIRQRQAKVRLIEQALTLAREQGALATVNHPNYRWSLDSDMLSELESLGFFEVLNGHPLCFSDGDGDHASTEAIWDHLLMLGRRVYGLATDDTHTLNHWGPSYANPGRGWVVVDAPERTPRAVQTALEGGRFYASTGVFLDELVVTRSTIELAVKARPGETYEVQFVTDGVDKLAGGEPSTEHTVQTLTARCEMPPGSTYLRATVRASSGERAWIQPVFGR